MYISTARLILVVPLIGVAMILFAGLLLALFVDRQ